jgi:hypothetical protein
LSSRYRILASLVFVFVLCAALSGITAEGQPIRVRSTLVGRSVGLRADGSLFGKCAALGLKPIRAKVTLFLAGDSVQHSPTLKVSWSAKPLPRKCGMHTVLAVRALVSFPKTGHSLEFGPDPNRPASRNNRWAIFWLGRTRVSDAERSYGGPVVTFNVGCVEDPRAWLRYEVRGRGGRSVARLVRPVPVYSEICQRPSR